MKKKQKIIHKIEVDFPTGWIVMSILIFSLAQCQIAESELNFKQHKYRNAIKLAEQDVQRDK